MKGENSFSHSSIYLYYRVIGERLLDNNNPVIVPFFQALLRRSVIAIFCGKTKVVEDVMKGNQTMS